jgi:hypothetical protein
MSPRILFFGMAMGLALAGCEKQEEAKPAAGSESGSKMTEAMNSAKDAAGQVTAAAKDATAQLVAGAETKITEITNYIKENKLDLAQKALDEVEKIKDKLPQAIQTKLADAKKMLESAQAAVKKPA